MKRSLSTVLAAVLASVVLAGCAGQPGVSVNVNTEPEKNAEAAETADASKDTAEAKEDAEAAEPAAGDK